MTKERAEVLSKLLVDDQERANRLLGLEPAEALKEINGLGYDFTLDEINEYGGALKVAIQQNGELNPDELDNVAGGIAPLVVAAAAGIAFVGSAVAAGIEKNGW